MNLRETVYGGENWFLSNSEKSILRTIMQTFKHHKFPLPVEQLAVPSA